MLQGTYVRPVSDKDPGLHCHRPLRRVPAVWALILMFSTTCAAQGLQDTFHDPRRKVSTGFSVDLDYPADVVLTFVRNVANSSIIRGTKIYRKDKSDEIDGAEFATTSKVFTDTPASGQVLYKIKKDAIAPEHFPGSNGEGTIIVRYIVQPITPQRTRLLIDAVFFQESLRARYFSDGNVESAESKEIQTQLSAFTASTNASTRPVQAAASKEISARPAQTTVPTEASPRPIQTAASAEASAQPVQPAVAAPNTAELQDALVREQGLLADEQAARQKLQEQLRQLQFNTQGRVNSEGIPLKSSPFNHSSTVVTLVKDERVMVLTTSRYWYRIKTPKGEEGWIYYVFLEPLR